MLRENIIKGEGLRKIARAQVTVTYNLYGKSNKDSLDNTRLYHGGNVPPCRIRGGTRDGRIYLSGEDTVATAAYVADPSKRMLILDFGSESGPKDGLVYSKYSQELALCCESNLYNILVNCEDKYKELQRITKQGLNSETRGNAALYVPDVEFMGNIKAEEYRDGYLYGNFIADVISCPSPDRLMILELKSRLKFLLEVAILNNIDTLVLGAWGCGRGKVDSDLMSMQMKAFLVDLGLARYFDSVVFAVPHYIDKGNYLDFTYAFNGVAEYLE